LQVIRALVPFQSGDCAQLVGLAKYRDRAANARAIKSLSYALGADLTDICDIPRYAWFSHKEDGSEIKPYHRSAVVMLIDQGFDTMEGASGDDWISGSQSMRAYLRGAVIAGIMAEFLRTLGFSALANQCGFRRAAHPACAVGGPRRALPYRRTRSQSFRWSTFQVGSVDHRFSARSGSADRFRTAIFLQSLPEMRA
jgi:hypothetical protein